MVVISFIARTLQKNVVASVSDPPKRYYTFRGSDIYQSTFLKSLNNIAFSYVQRLTSATLSAGNYEARYQQKPQWWCFVQVRHRPWLDWCSYGLHSQKFMNNHYIFHQNVCFVNLREALR